MEPSLDIGEVADRTGTTASALRYYERRGLISSTGRNGLRRTFARDVVQRLVFIRCAQDAGFTLAEIARVLAATPEDDAIRQRMHRRALALDEEIAQLTRMRDGLRHAASCSHSPLVECPEFKELLRAPITT